MDIEMLSDVMDDIIEYIAKLEKASLSVGELFYEHVTSETHQILDNYFRGCNDLAHVLVATLENSQEIAPQINVAVMPSVMELMEQFATIQLLLIEGRSVELADLLKYEIPPKLQHIAKLLEETKYK